MLDSPKPTCTSGLVCRLKLMYTDHKSTWYTLIGISVAAIMLFFIFVLAIEKVTKRKKKIGNGFRSHSSQISELNLIKKEHQISQSDYPHPMRTTLDDEGYF